jgi:hypothetical protein
VSSVSVVGPAPSNGASPRNLLSTNAVQIDPRGRVGTSDHVPKRCANAPPDRCRRPTAPSRRRARRHDCSRSRRG